MRPDHRRRAPRASAGAGLLWQTGNMRLAASPEVKALLEPDGATPMALSPADLARRVREDLAIWKKIAVEKKILAD